MLERAVSQRILHSEWLLDNPVDTMAGSSFQELFVRSPIKLCSFGIGIGSLVQSPPTY